MGDGWMNEWMSGRMDKSVGDWIDRYSTAENQFTTTQGTAMRDKFHTPRYMLHGAIPRVQVVCDVIAIKRGIFR